MSVSIRVLFFFAALAAGGCAASGQFGEALRAPEPPGYAVSSRSNTGGIEHVEMVPTAGAGSESLRTEVLKGGVEEGDPVRYAEWATRRFKDRCTAPRFSTVEAGDRNGYPSATWRMDCPSLKSGGRPETVVILAIQGAFAFYTVQKTWLRAPSEAEVESWRRSYFDNVVLCDSRSDAGHPCPKGPPGAPPLRIAEKPRGAGA